MSSDMTKQLLASTNVVWHHATVTRACREAQNRHRGAIILPAFISSYRVDRERVCGMVEHGDLIEIYCDTPIAICETRDVKGIYKKARAGEVSSSYEVPENSELTMNAGVTELDVCVQQLTRKIMNLGVCALQLDPTLESASKKYCQGSGAQS